MQIRTRCDYAITLDELKTALRADGYEIPQDSTIQLVLIDDEDGPVIMNNGIKVSWENFVRKDRISAAKK